MTERKKPQTMRCCQACERDRPDVPDLPKLPLCEQCARAWRMGYRAGVDSPEGIVEAEIAAEVERRLSVTTAQREFASQFVSRVAAGNVSEGIRAELAAAFAAYARAGSASICLHYWGDHESGCVLPAGHDGRDGHRFAVTEGYLSALTRRVDELEAGCRRLLRVVDGGGLGIAPSSWVEAIADLRETLLRRHFLLGPTPAPAATCPEHPPASSLPALACRYCRVSKLTFDPSDAGGLRDGLELLLTYTEPTERVAVTIEPVKKERPRT